MSTSIPILRGAQQGSVLSPNFFLVIMDELLHRLSERGFGAFIYHLYLHVGGAAHADNVRAIASSTSVAQAQGVIIIDFSLLHGLHLNRTKTKFSKSTMSIPAHFSLVDSTVTTCIYFMPG